MLKMITRKPKNPKKITVEVEREDYIKLKVYLAKRDESIAQWIRESILNLK